MVHQQVKPMVRYKDSKYYHIREYDPALVSYKTFKTVPLSHTGYKGQKYAEWLDEHEMPNGEKARAMARIAIPKARMADVRKGKVKKSNAAVIVEILIPKLEAFMK